MTYLAFIREERKPLSFALSFTFFSSFGQTFLISLFVPYFLSSFSLTNTTFGILYSIATLTSAAFLPYLGRLIDVMPLRRYSLFVAAGLLLSALTVAISWHFSVLFLGITLLRLTGQGLSGHTAQTTMAKKYESERGKALSISSLGYPIGEGLLPVAIAGVLAIVHWRATWFIIAVIITVGLIPIILYLTSSGTQNHQKESSEKSKKKKSAILEYKKILSQRDIPFVIPASLLPPFWITGLFLYQVSTASSLGWTAAIIASSFLGFAVTRVLFSLIAGPLVDRFSARTLFPYLLVPMAGGLFIGAFYEQNWSAFLYMGLLGATMGMSGTIKDALWAELFDKKIIGTVRSLMSSLMVFSTSLSPFIMGWMLDGGMHITTVFYLAAVTMGFAALLSIRILFR